MLDHMVKLLAVGMVILIVAILGKIILSPKNPGRKLSVIFPSPTPSWVRETLTTMTTEEKVGQMFIIGFQGTTLSPELKMFLTTYRPGGVVLFSRNIQTQDQLATLNKNLQETATVSARIPFIIAIDEEGGNVVRIPWDHETTPQYIIENKEQAFAIAKKRGEELATLGINVNLAPVVETPFQADSFIARQKRAFISSSSSKHQDLISATIDGYHAAGIAVIPKHYPGGLGRVSPDPHEALPNIDIENADLENDISAFITIGKKSGAIMTTHLLYPAVSRDPVTFSTVFIERYLRQKNSYEGVVVTDDLAMGALKEYQLEEIIEKGINAGVDIFLISRPLTRQRQAIEIIKELVEKGEVSEDRLNESVGRILSFKDRLN